MPLRPDQHRRAPTRPAAAGLALALGLATLGVPAGRLLAAPEAGPIGPTATEASMAGVNAMDRDAFVTRFGGIFEHSPWVAERAWVARPFANLDRLHAAMVAVTRSAPRVEILALLNAHPELAGKEARDRQMTSASVSEQGSAGLDRMSEAEFDAFDRLNAAYRARFGFPFIIAVRGRNRVTILAEFERRLAQAPDVEIDAALTEVAAITRMRLDRAFATAP